MIQLVFFVAFIKAITCANILCVFVLPFISHQTVYQLIWKELSLKGHTVTVLTPNPINDSSLTNLTEIDLSFTYEIISKQKFQSSLTNGFLTVLIREMYNKLIEIAEAELSHPPVQALINDQSKHFDLLIVEFYHPAMFALSTKFNCPFIGITTTDAFTTGYDAVGNPSHPVLNSDILLPFVPHGFTERLSSVMFMVWFRIYYAYSVLPRHDEMARKYISSTIPYIGLLEKNASLLFLNVNPITHSKRPTVPAIIELGSLHVGRNSSLPADLQEELDSAKEGVVYFSLGSNIRNVELSSELLQEIIPALSEIPYKVLLKWESDSFPNKPKNVITRKWFPQQDVLGHKNVKVFVTQGGLQSLEEAIYNCVPLVIIPFFGDQPLNAARMSKLGIAKVIDFNTLTKEELKQAIIEVAQNDKYHTEMKKVSELTHDVPMTGLEKAIWWTEYVIRHKGAAHLRSPAIDMPWYEYLLLDVIGFVLVVLVVLIYVIYKFIRLTLCLLSKVLVRNKVKVS